MIRLIVMLFLYSIGCLCIGVSLAPALGLFHQVTQAVSQWDAWLRWVAQGCAIAICYFVYGIALIFVVSLTNRIFPLRLKKWKGSFYSFEGYRWYFHNGLTYLVRHTFLPMVTPSPLNNLFYRLMGMKLGKDVMINSQSIADPCLIEIGDFTLIGGGASIIAHYGVGRVLVTAPVSIGPRVTVGLQSTLMAGVHIGEGAKILPHSVLLPNTRVPANEIWGGVPAQKIGVNHRN